MTEQDRPGSKESTRRSSPALAQVIETQRQQLSQIGALVDSQANLLHESHRFEVDEADLGYCCDRDMLERILTALGSVTRAPAAESALRSPCAWRTRSKRRARSSFGAQAVARAIENLLRTHELSEHEADLRAAMEKIVQLMEDVLSAIEPLNLGLPIPEF